MRVEINGEQHEVEAGITVADLLVRLGLGAQLVAVERNKQIVPRAEHGTTPLSDGDALEVVHFVGGG